MGRDVDERKKRAALRKLRKAAELAEQGKGPPLSDWERQFLEEVEERIEKYGSAFADPMKGDDGEALSALQQVKLKEIDKKARGKARKGFSQKAGGGKKPPKGSFTKRTPPRVRQLDDDLEEDLREASAPTPPPRAKPVLKAVPTEAVPEKGQEVPRVPQPGNRPAFRVIEGGKSEPGA
ncbi:MAG: hypothetical protein IE925_08785 [Rhodobacterales bacterium]|jgi:hypothetical protein|nr:hypothetical protein [Rhodobacterales bacterium]